MNKKIIDLIKEFGNVFYLATIDGDKARVRPFAAIMDFDGKLYFTTSNVKDVYRQLVKNPNFEISATSPDRQQWLRLTAKAVFSDSPEAKAQAFKELPFLANIYGSSDNPKFTVFYAENPKAFLYSMTGSKREIL
jgi:uncharacterized pyridoxamine 5'-phosphate oxidase family protein